MADLTDNVKVKAGRLIRVRNTKRKPLKHGKILSGAELYYAVWVEDADGGNERCLLFTPKQIEVAEARAERNQEDIPAKGFIAGLFD